MTRITAALASLARSLRAILGAPDYDSYVSHMRARHAGSPVLTRDEFARDRSDQRYDKPGSRCC